MSKVCLSCDTENNDDTEFCTSCGKKIESKVTAKYDKEYDIIYMTIIKPDNTKIVFSVSSKDAPLVLDGPLSDAQSLIDVVKSGELTIISNDTAAFWEKVHNRIKDYAYKHRPR